MQRQIGFMEFKLTTLWWSLLGALDQLGDDFSPDDRALAAVMIAKRQIVTEAPAVVDLAHAGRRRQRLFQVVSPRAGLP